MITYINKDGNEYNSFIYLWEDKIYKKFYIGSHIGNIEDGYLFSGIDIKKEYAERPFDFERTILSYHITQSMIEIRNIEKEYLQKYDVENNESFYNRTNESYGGYHKKSVEKRLRDLDENGLNCFQRSAKKMVETRKNNNSYKTAKIKEYKTKKNKMEDISNKISKTLIGSCWVNKDEDRKYIKPSEIENYLKDGWNIGIINFCTFDECKNLARENNIITNTEWRNFAKINNLPVHPNRTFKNDWTSWEDFLSKKNSKSHTYDDCLKFAKDLNICSKTEWHKSASKLKLPYHPDRKFKNVWVSWDEFLK